MSLVTFTNPRKTRLGWIVGEEIADLSAPGLPGSMPASLDVGAK